MGGIQSAVGGWAGQFGPMFKMVATSAVAGAGNEAMGGKFQDGFISSLKSQAISAGANMAAKMAMSLTTREYWNGIGGVSRSEEGTLLWNAAYDLNDQMEQFNQIFPTKLDLPKNWRYVKFFSNHEESYLDYAVFENSVTGIRVMVPVGTSSAGGLFGDWLDNFKQGLGFKSIQYMKAIEYGIIEQNNAASSGMKFVVVGHSLGGGLGAAISAVTGAPALIYNAAGLNPMTLRYAGYADRIPAMGQNIVHYGVGGEVLTTMQNLLFFAPNVTASRYYSWAPKGQQSLVDWSFIEWHRPKMTLNTIR